MISVHCVAHSEALGTKTLVKDMVEFKAINNLVHSIVNFFAHSPKRVNTLKEAERELDQEELKVVRCIDTRWLSSYMAIKRILQIYSPLVVAISNVEGSTSASGIVMQLSKFKISALLHAFADVLKELHKCMLIFQNKALSLEDYSDSLKTLRASLVTMEDGERRSNFKANFDKDTKKLYGKTLIWMEKSYEEHELEIIHLRKEAC